MRMECSPYQIDGRCRYGSRKNGINEESQCDHVLFPLDFRAGQRSLIEIHSIPPTLRVSYFSVIMEQRWIPRSWI